ncbi:hypothetical protein GCM10010428_50230 [Actinosynnema pretiosum subsp. pretiosum]
MNRRRRHTPNTLTPPHPVPKAEHLLVRPSQGVQKLPFHRTKSTILPTVHGDPHRNPRTRRSVAQPPSGSDRRRPTKPGEETNRQQNLNSPKPKRTNPLEGVDRTPNKRLHRKPFTHPNRHNLNLKPRNSLRKPTFTKRTTRFAAGRGTGG